jgi:hypothetical protein
MCQLQLDGLARSILQRRLKALYSHLGSGVRARANGALALLAAVVGRSRALCAEVLAAFDFGLDSLPKLAAGPKGSQVWPANAESPLRSLALSHLPSNCALVAKNLSLCRTRAQRLQPPYSRRHGVVLGGCHVSTNPSPFSKRCPLHTVSTQPSPAAASPTEGAVATAHARRRTPAARTRSPRTFCGSPRGSFTSSSR